MKDLRIVFFGTPGFAASILDKLVENNYNIVSAVTVPDKPAGRGRKLLESDVKKVALKHNLNILQPEKLRDPEFLDTIKNLNPDLFIVIAFRMMPKILWSIPEKGTFNLHASLLPQYRGAAPINWAIINGEKKSGITTFFINDEIDQGKIILSKEIEIDENDNAGSYHDKLMHAGSDLVINTIDLIEEGNFETYDQFNNGDLKEAPKIFKEDSKINWNNNKEIIRNLIRGMSPYPGAWSVLYNQENEFEVKIFDVKIADESTDLEPGKVFLDNKKLKVAVNDGVLEVLELQIPGKKRLKTKDLLNGYNFEKTAFFK